MSSTVSPRYKKQDISYTKSAKIKRRRKKKKIDFRKLGIVAAVTLLCLLAGYMIYTHLPFVKVNKAIAAGDKYSQSADYQAAIDSYKKAIEIDEQSVTAYSNMAGAYLSIDDSESAKNVLYDGWTNTGSEALLKNYHAVIVNQAVEAVNNSQADLSTVLSVVSVLSEDNTNTDAIEFLNSAYPRVFSDAYGYNVDALFRSDCSTYSSEGGSATYTFEEYEAMINKLLDIYSVSPSEALKSVIVSYATPGDISFTLNMDNVSAYSELLSKVMALGTEDTSVSSMKECLDNSQEVLSVFTDIFVQLDVGNVDELRDFVVSDQYLKLRDVFLNNEYTPQENTTYVPVSREAIILNNNDGKWTYRFLDFDEYPDTEGVITVWANFFEDDGVQRNAISYEPASIDDNYYPHTKYNVTYLYSYITSGGSTKVAKMNYRLETQITGSDGNVSETVVGDWGGENEWTMDIDTIESRIKA